MIKKAILAIIANSMVLWGITEILPSYLIITGGLPAFVIPGIFLGILNSLFKPVLKLISLPLIILTAGLFSVVVNACVVFILEFGVNLIKITEMSLSVQGGFLSYVIVGFVLAVLNEFAHWLIKK